MSHSFMFLRPRLAPALTPLSWFSRSRSAIMPLKAKIIGSVLSRQAAKISTTASDTMEEPMEEPGDDPDDVQFGSHYGVRTIELNRPNKLNSLNGSMARKILARLKEWEKSQLANIIIIGGAGPKAFCAGGDVAAIALQNASGPDGQDRSKAFFALEYRLNYLIATYSKPYVAYMDGITMGGGLGLSVHAPFRIATERTIVAMPETSIGFFPDVGTSFFLPRLDGYIGTYLALTSNRLNGVNAYYAGIATNYIDSSSLPGLTARLSELEFGDRDSFKTKIHIIEATIEEFSSGIPYNEPMLIAGEVRRAIHRCFQHERIEQILTALDGEKKGEISAWATQTKQAILERCPFSVKMTLKLMRESKNYKLSQTLERDYAIASHFMVRPDFASGVSALLIDKPPTTPKWDPPRLEEVKEHDVDEYFRPKGEDILELEKRDKVPGLPGLPREKEVKQAVILMDQSNAQDARRIIVAKMMRERGGKIGVKEKVEEALDRNCEVGSRGELVWASDK